MAFFLSVSAHAHHRLGHQNMFPLLGLKSLDLISLNCDVISDEITHLRAMPPLPEDATPEVNLIHQENLDLLKRFERLFRFQCHSL